MPASLILYQAHLDQIIVWVTHVQAQDRPYSPGPLHRTFYDSDTLLLQLFLYISKNTVSLKACMPCVTAPCPPVRLRCYR